MSNENSVPAIKPEVVEAVPGDIDQYNKPEQFCFAVELWQETPIATICPIEYFKETGYLDDALYTEIEELLGKNNFFMVLEAAYELDDEGATIETVTNKMIELGFKQVPEFDKYMTETNADFSSSIEISEIIDGETIKTDIDAEAITQPANLLESLETVEPTEKE